MTILIDERPDGVHLSYDTVASFLTSYGSLEAMKVTQNLDSKVEMLLTAAASYRPGRHRKGFEQSFRRRRTLFPRERG